MNEWTKWIWKISFIISFLCLERHIIVGAEEGIYSLNFSEQLHEAEMEQVIQMTRKQLQASFRWVNSLKAVFQVQPLVFF